VSKEALSTDERGRFMFWLSCFLGEYQWFRRWYGGKWSQWTIFLNLTRNPLWVQGWDRPGCGLECHARESWP
jgi:hypothetical protein